MASEKKQFPFPLLSSTIEKKWYINNCHISANLSYNDTKLSQFLTHFSMKFE